MVECYYAIGTTLANMVNVETYFDTPPYSLNGAVIPLLGGNKTRVGDFSARRDGIIVSDWNFTEVTRDNFNAFIYAIYGGFTTASKPVYISSIDETGYYSPFLVQMDKPHAGENYRIVNDYWIADLTLPLFDCQLQSVTKTANYTVTTSDRLVYGNTASGNITLTLPALATVTADTVYSFQKLSASNTLELDANSTETIAGQTTQAITALNGRLDIAKESATNWIIVNS
jgi:hypothetical protein